MRSQYYCGGLYCGLPMVAFWRHNANAKYAWFILNLPDIAGKFNINIIADDYDCAEDSCRT